MQYTSTIPSSRVKEVETKIKAYNKKAIKFGFDQATLSFGETTVKDITVSDVFEGTVVKERKVSIECIEVTLEYSDSIKIGNYSLISVFDRYDDTVLTRTVPGQTLPREYFDKKAIECQHCNTKRRRNTSYLLFNGTEYKEVGKTCLQLYFGVDPKGFVAQAGLTDIIQYIMEDDQAFEDEYKMGRAVIAADLIGYLTCVVCAIELWGWVSRKMQQESYTEISCTCDAANAMYYSGIEAHKTTEKHTDTAKQIIAYFESLDIESLTSEYMVNCHKIAKMGYVTFRFEGIAASMASTWLREQEKQSRAKTSEYFGTVGERTTINNLTVKKSIYLENMMYPAFLYIFQDANGQTFVWKSSNDKGFKINEIVNLKATIKDHREYQDIKQTVITRCAIVKPK